MALTKRQKKVARLAPPRNKITGADLAVLRRRKKRKKRK
tara:strand:- start:13 stop:129 length:117 start_codon:yes stop_codon:yes gene_type:complete